MSAVVRASLAVVALFLVIFAFEIYGCFWVPIPGVGTSPTTYGYCHDLHDFKDVQPFASATFTALGAAVAFYFAERKHD